MTNRIQLEPEAQAFAEAAVKPPWLFTLGPEQGRTALDEVQAGHVSKPLVDIEELTIADGPSAQVALRILRPENTQASLPFTADVHDDRQRSLRVLGPQDAKSNFRAGTGFNGDRLHVHQGLAHMARLHLIKGGPSLFGTKGEQPGWLHRSLCERLRLGFKLNPVGHWSRSSITNDNSRREPGKMASIHLTPPRSDSTAGTRPYVCGRVLADCSPPPALHLSERMLLLCSILISVLEVTGHRVTLALHIPSHRSVCEKERERERP